MWIINISPNRILSNDRSIFANDRKLSANARIVLLKIAYLQSGPNNFSYDPIIYQDRYTYMIVYFTFHIRTLNHLSIVPTTFSYFPHYLFNFYWTFQLPMTFSTSVIAFQLQWFFPTSTVTLKLRQTSISCRTSNLKLSNFSFFQLNMEWISQRRTEADESGQMGTKADECGRLTNADRL